MANCHPLLVFNLTYLPGLVALMLLSVEVDFDSLLFVSVDEGREVELLLPVLTVDEGFELLSLLLTLLFSVAVLSVLPTLESLLPVVF